MPLPTTKSPAQPRVGKVLLFAEPKTGKSTLSMMLDPERTIAFDVEDGLSAIEGYKHAIKSWGRVIGVEGTGRDARPIFADDSFRGAVKLLHEEEHPYLYVTVDTADALAKLCADYVLANLGAGQAQTGYVHASDFEWGKGWAAITDEWSLRIGALCRVVPNVILISHADVAMKTDRTNAEYPVFTSALGPKGVRQWTLGFMEHILFLNVERNDDDEDMRVVHSRKTRSWDAGGRVPIGATPIPDPLWLPNAETAGALLRAALEGVAGDLSGEKAKTAETKGEASGTSEGGQEAPETAAPAKKPSGRRPRAKAKQDSFPETENDPAHAGAAAAAAGTGGTG